MWNKSSGFETFPLACQDNKVVFGSKKLKLLRPQKCNILLPDKGSRSILEKMTSVHHHSRPQQTVSCFVSLLSAGFVLSWPGRRSRDVTSVRTWCPASLRSSWAKTRPSPTTTCSTWTPSRTPSTPPAPRSWLTDALRATMPPSSHTDRRVLVWWMVDAGQKAEEKNVGEV